MRWLTELRGRLARVEVRLGLALCASLALLVATLLGALFLISTHESAELRAEMLAAELRETAAELAAGGDAASARPAPSEMALRRIFPTGESATLSGAWPQGRSLRAGTRPLRLVFAGERDFWVEQLPLPDGGRLEGALELASFVRERRELATAILHSFAIGLLGIFAASVLLTRLALAPLRRLTRAVESIDERNLGARLELRGTDDDLDRLGRTLNRVFERLENAFARLRSYGADVAHELRTPLNRLLNLVDVALLPNASEPAERTLEAVREATREMQHLVEDMLLLARGEESRLRLVPEPLRLADVVSDLVELYTPACDERGIALELKLDPTAGEIVTDRALLQRALANLLDNAVRHTPSRGRIDLELEAGDGGARLTICDTGPGIPPAERERVFERFVQLDASRGNGGAGLGLPIARMIARLLGGGLTASASPTGGARFELTIRPLLRPAGSDQR